MKNKKLKGFTLIECLVSLAILGIASLVMCEIYGNVSRMNRENDVKNTSLMQQMKIVEKAINGDTLTEKFDDTKVAAANKVIPPHANTADGINAKNNIANKTPYIKLTGDYKCPEFASAAQYSYSYEVDFHVVQSYDKKGNKVAINQDLDKDGKTNDEDFVLNYKYLTAH